MHNASDETNIQKDNQLAESQQKRSKRQQTIIETLAKPLPNNQESTMMDMYHPNTPIQTQTKVNKTPTDPKNKKFKNTTNHKLEKPSTATSSPIHTKMKIIPTKTTYHTDQNHNPRGILSERSQKPSNGSGTVYDKNANSESGKRKCHKYGMRKRRKICYSELDDEISEKSVEDTYMCTLHSLT